MGGSNMPRQTSTMASRVSSGDGGRAAEKSKVNHLCIGGNGRNSNPAPARACPNRRVQRGLRSARSTGLGGRVVAGDHHHVGPEVVARRQVEVGKDPMSR